MTDVFHLSLLIAFFWAAMKPGMVLSWLSQIFEKTLWRFGAKVFLLLRKPLFACMTCMASVWGIPLAYIFGYFNGDWKHDVALILQASGLNYFLELLYVSGTKLIEYTEKQGDNECNELQDGTGSDGMGV